jgi:hypothetical protein
MFNKAASGPQFAEQALYSFELILSEILSFFILFFIYLLIWLDVMDNKTFGCCLILAAFDMLHTVVGELE